MSHNSKFKWEFTSKDILPDGKFTVKNANRINRLYYPLFNMQGMMSAITPELKGDIKTSQNTFLLEPQVTENLHQTKNSRNFWIKTSKGDVWSVPGISASELANKALNNKKGNTDVEAAPGYFKIIRKNNKFNLHAEIEVFVPHTGEPLEISLVTIINEGDKALSFTPTAAIPLYGRSADNLRDHRQVTTLLNRIEKNDNSVYLKPTMSFDERGHKPGVVTYSASGFLNEDEPLLAIHADLESFIGEGGSLEAPYLIYSDEDFNDTFNLEGRQAIAGLRFKEVILNPKESITFSVVLGIHKNTDDIKNTLKNFNSSKKCKKSLIETIEYWQNQVKRLQFVTDDATFNNWMVWVSLQPLMRRVFGCSFLPDFGYGRGGRGWRDLWQDCLGILLTNPIDARELLANNIQGVRIDGSNATIIGLKPGEFVADRNNIPRTWMDHGVWPMMTIDFYIQQTGDLEILLDKRPFFQDQFSHRCKKVTPLKSNSTWLLNKNGEKVESSLILHLIVQNLTQFYNRGENGNIRLEDADWNDGLDMAHKKGESVPFSAAYAGNLYKLAAYIEMLSNKGISDFSWPKEIKLLFSDLNSNNMSSPSYLQNILENYFNSVENGISGELEKFNLKEIQQNLIKKADSLSAHIQKNEFIKAKEHEYFNGYYNNDGLRVEGLIDGIEQMSLTAQVFPIMSNVASISQCKKAFEASKDLLQDKIHGGFRLNTNFNKIMLNLGRAFSFSYGDKENGSFFSHMNVMFANALYKRGLVKEGFTVLNSIYKMSTNTEKSLIFPCVPEYFNSNGRGMYCYITGSGSWLTMTMLVEVFGIKGSMGDLCLNPKLLKKQFNSQKKAIVNTLFHGKKMTVTYNNPKLLSFGSYNIKNITLNNERLDYKLSEKGAVIEKELLNVKGNIDIAVYLE